MRHTGTTRGEFEVRRAIGVAAGAPYLGILPLLLSTAFLALLSVFGDVLGQNLPGPAGGGWYVLMAVNPNGGRISGSGFSSIYVHRCTAWVVPSSHGAQPSYIRLL